MTSTKFAWKIEARHELPQRPSSLGDRRRLSRTFRDTFGQYLKAPYLSYDEIKNAQLSSLKLIINDAYENVPFYQKKYKAVGLHPRDIRTWEDFLLIPPVTKEEMLAAPSRDRINRKYYTGPALYQTRSTGTTGTPLTIYVNREGIFHNNIQGVRQIWLQTSGEYRADHKTLTTYREPWCFPKVGPGYRFISASTLLSGPQLMELAVTVAPFAMSIYPSHLAVLMQNWRHVKSLRLIAVHSEQSTPDFRRYASIATGVPVLDEYSSEEAMRIALELPCGHYHICEDASFVELLPVTEGSESEQEIVISNMLNTAMPFIRYRQGDFARIPAKTAQSCGLAWRQLESLDGRRNDNFISNHGMIISAGTLLDITYHWLGRTPEVARFELLQVASDRVRLTVEIVPFSSTETLQASVSEHLENLLSIAFRHHVTVDLRTVDHLPAGKRTPIQSAL